MNSRRMEPIVAAALAAFVWAAFFCPWLRVESRPANDIKKAFGIRGESEMVRVSGYDIPEMANAKGSRVASAVGQLFSSDAKDVGKRSYRVWILPILASLLAVLTWLSVTRRRVALTIAVVGAAVFGLGTYKILAADLDGVLFVVHVASGLWLTLVAYLAMGLLNFRLFILANESRQGQSHL